MLLGWGRLRHNSKKGATLERRTNVSANKRSPIYSNPKKDHKTGFVSARETHILPWKKSLASVWPEAYHPFISPIFDIKRIFINCEYFEASVRPG